jgi:hypothetical protein
MKPHLDSLIPSNFDEVCNLIGNFENGDSTFRGKPVVGNVDFFETVTCKKVSHEIEIELSDIQVEAVENGPQAIYCIAIFAKTPLGRLYVQGASEDALSAHPCLLAEVRISSDETGSYIESSNDGEVLKIALGLDLQKFSQIARQLRKRVYSRLRIALELWQSDRNGYYLRSDCNQIKSLELIATDSAGQLDYRLEELLAVVLCRLAGEEVCVDDGKTMHASRNTVFFRAIITFIEVVAGTVFIYWHFF